MWILDFAGGQLGFTTAIHEWTQYEADYVHDIEKIFELGTQKRVLAEAAKWPGRNKICYGVVGVAAAELDKAIDTWEATNGSISGLRTLKDTEFQHQKTTLLDALDQSVRDCITTNELLIKVLYYKAKVYDSHSNNSDAFMATRQLFREADLLKRNMMREASLIECLRKKHGPGYTYQDGDKYTVGPHDLSRDFASVTKNTFDGLSEVYRDIYERERVLSKKKGK